MTTKVEKLLRFGFPTAELCRGGDESSQCPKWLCQRQQNVLLDQLKAFSIETAKIAADMNLSDAGKVAKRRELALATLSKLKSEDIRRPADNIRHKLDGAKNRMSAMEKSAGETDTDRLIHQLKVAGVQAFLGGLDGSELSVELNASVATRNRVTFDAITTIPTTILRTKGITSGFFEGVVREWRKGLNPGLAEEIDTGEQMLQLAEQNLQSVIEAVQEAGGIEERKVTVTK